MLGVFLRIVLRRWSSIRKAKVPHVHTLADDLVRRLVKRQALPSLYSDKCCNVRCETVFSHKEYMHTRWLPGSAAPRSRVGPSQGQAVDCETKTNEQPVTYTVVCAVRQNDLEAEFVLVHIRVCDLLHRLQVNFAEGRIHLQQVCI